MCVRVCVCERETLSIMWIKIDMGKRKVAYSKVLSTQETIERK